MSVITLRNRIFDDFCPRLEKALAANDDAQLYGIVPEIQEYFNCFRMLAEEVKSFIAQSVRLPEITRFQSQISEATQRMEIEAQKHFITRLNACVEDAEKIAFIRTLGLPDTDFGCPMLNFERLPELHDERIAAGIDHTSTVLILGTGSISITGLYFASFGAKVILLDRDPRALENFDAVYKALPRQIQGRIEFARVCDARDYEYPDGLTHVFMAALLEPKEPIVRRIHEVYKGRARTEPLTLLLRAPREDLMQLFYFDVDRDALQGFSCTGKVDMGFEKQTSVSFVLTLD